jgi:NAD-dependent SIR2 family protein deacetylase
MEVIVKINVWCGSCGANLKNISTYVAQGRQSGVHIPVCPECESKMVKEAVSLRQEILRLRDLAEELSDIILERC